MLNHLPLALIVSRQALENDLLSARPDAPVVTEGAAASLPRTYRTRAALAAGLARVSDVVAPVDWAPRQTLSSR